MKLWFLGCFCSVKRIVSGTGKAGIKVNVGKRVIMMVYLERFVIPSSEQEDKFFWCLYDRAYDFLPKRQLQYYENLRTACHNSVYPFHIFTAESGFSSLEFEPITIFYGGKRTVLQLPVYHIRSFSVFTCSAFFTQNGLNTGLGAS